LSAAVGGFRTGTEGIESGPLSIRFYQVPRSTDLNIPQQFADFVAEAMSGFDRCSFSIFPALFFYLVHTDVRYE
jgi:hypothetical protein